MKKAQPLPKQEVKATTQSEQLQTETSEIGAYNDVSNQLNGLIDHVQKYCQ